MNGKLGVWTLAAVALVLTAAMPCLAGTATPERATAAAESAAVADPCGQALALFGGLEAILELPAPEAVEAIPIAARPQGFRTCVCSCGSPCKTDADCGAGGRCGAGITCCARPTPGVAPSPAAEHLRAETSIGT
jgi:hypothetical protein